MGYRTVNICWWWTPYVIKSIGRYMKKVFKHLRVYILRGVIASIPFVLTFVIVRFLYLTIDQRIMGLIDETIGFKIPGLGILILFIVFYFLGLIVSNVVGRKLLSMVEMLTRYIPFVKTTYQVGKQLSNTLSLPDRESLKRAVLVEYLKPGMWTIGFVTGTVVNKNDENEKYLKVFVPMPPNPASGVMILVKESQTRDPGWSIEESFRSIISAGIIGPDEID
ncbi:DUF502 domain-containing protein [Candidatus Poribacteria bacterium]|nr:DUF502 domain-containing protein [Candidatus Poribacteria bacterium]